MTATQPTDPTPVASSTWMPPPNPNLGLRPPPVVIVEAPPNVPAIVVARLRTRDLTTTVFAPTPGTGRKIGPATEALEALGKRRDVTGRPRGRTELAELVPLWFTAHRVKRLIAVPNPGLNANNLLDIVDMLAATPTQLVFACDHGHASTLARELESAAPHMAPWPDHPALHSNDPLPTPASLALPPEWSAETVALPQVEYWVFYATAQRQLTTLQFAPVDRLYRDTYERVTRWLHDLGPNAEHLTVELAFGCLKTIIEEQATLDEVIVATRATQAAHHHAGWFLNIDERELRNGLIRFPPSKTTPETYEALRAIFEPARTATVALYLAGATPDAIERVTVDDLAHWHHDPHQPVADIHPPDAAAPYLRAALMAAALEGQPPNEPAFPGDQRRVLRDIRQAAQDLGLNIGDSNLNKNSQIGDRRVPERILKLEHIA